MYFGRFSISVGIILVFLLLHIKNCQGWHCMRIPLRDQTHSIGANWFEGETNDEFSTVFAGTNEKDTRFAVDIYPVMINNKELKGWLRLNFKFKNESETCEKNPKYKQRCKQLVAMRLSAEDENLQNVGEFSDLPAKYCKDATEISKYQLVPCQGTPANEPLQPVGILYTSPIIFKNVKKEYVLPETLDSEANYYWKFSQFYCNKKEKIRFRLYAVTVGTNLESNSGGAESSVFVRYFWVTINDDFTVADPFPTDLDENTKVSCSSDDIQDKRTTWYKVPTAEHMAGVSGTSSCGYGDTTGTYVGRCVGNGYNDVSFDNELVCSQSNISRYTHITHYDTYIAERFTNLSIERDSLQCCKVNEKLNQTLVEEIERIIVVPLPTTPTTTTPTTTTPTTTKAPTLEELEEAERIGLVLWPDSHDPWSTGGRIWRMRKFHGIFMSILTLFVIPVNFFMTRYYKETFMKTRVQYCMVWYFVHLMSVPLGAFFLSLGTHVARKSSQVAGHSWTAAASEHRIMGWTIIIGCFILTATGGVRFYKDVGRRVCMCFHWLYGTVVYICLLVMMMRSTLIPGSPSASYDKAGELPGAKSLAVFYNQTVIYLVSLWILIEIIFHIIMSLHLCKMDRKLKFVHERRYTPAPIPILHQLISRDLPGSTFRKILLVIYICLSALITVGVCMIIARQSVMHRGFGIMKCSHDKEGGWRTKETQDPECGGRKKWIF